MTIEPAKDAPLVLNLNGIQRVYQSVEEEDDDGEVQLLKLRASKEFKDLLNGLTYSLLADSISNAVEAGRTTIWAEDLPTIQEV